MADFDSLPILCYIYPFPPFLIITFYNAQRSRRPFIIICLTLSSTTVTHKELAQRVLVIKRASVAGGSNKLASVLLKHTMELPQRTAALAAY